MKVKAEAETTEDSSSVITLDPEFAALIPPLSPDEAAHLAASIQKEGCRDPLVVWKEEHILLDGHNRYRICREHDVLFKTSLVSFPSREEARTYVIKNQLARRNLSPEAISYLRGKRYLESKHQGQRSNVTSGQSDPKRISEVLADEYKIGEKTIRREAKFAEAVDQIAEKCGVEAKQLILSRDVNFTRGNVLRLAKLKPAEQKKYLEVIRETGKRPRTKRPKGKRSTITLPTEPQSLAEKLVQYLGNTDAAKVAGSINEAIRKQLHETNKRKGTKSSKD